MTPIPQHVHRQTEDRNKRRNTRLGPLSANSAHVPHHMPDRVDFSGTTRVSNASSREQLSMSQIWTTVRRPDSMRAFLLPSKGGTQA